MNNGRTQTEAGLLEQPADAVTRHPGYEEENTYLSRTVSSITNSFTDINPYEISGDRLWDHYGGADEWTAMIFHQRAIQKWRDVQDLQKDPYFGRIIFDEIGVGAESRYIGRIGFKSNEIEIIDWRAPIANLFYIQNPEKTGLNSYLAPRGPVYGNLLLKRRLEIQNGTLKQILDEINRLKGQDGGEDQSEHDFLINELEKRGDPHLQDIVKTIQEHQNRLIRYPAQAILLIDGVAGSGKTSVAYHRLAYLLYPDTKSGINPGRTIIFSPNRLFLSYVKNLLPRLGVKGVQEVTFDDWALQNMRLLKEMDGKKERTVEVMDASMPSFLSPNTSQIERRNLWIRARLKGSLKMKELLERYAEFYRQQVKFPEESWQFNHLGSLDLDIVILEKEIRRICQEVFAVHRPLESQREEILRSLLQFLDTMYDQVIEKKYEDMLRWAGDDPLKQQQARSFRNRAFAVPANRREVVRAAMDILHDYMDDSWRSLSWEDYYTFLADFQLLQRLGKGIFSETEITLLGSTQHKENQIDIEDIPALLYFFILIHGKGEARYDHVVVDEAQDFSPLQFWILKSSISKNSMTVVGDLSQGIFAHRGLAKWSELDPVFGEGEIQVEKMNQNYRATQEIVKFTNEVNRIVQKSNYYPARPVFRSGAKPRMILAKNLEIMHGLLDIEINVLTGRGKKNIGIIAKTQKECEDILNFLRTVNKKNIPRLISDRDAEYDYQGGVVLLPISLAKGLEFEAAMVCNVNRDNFDLSVEYDGRLLYVALTRALHDLTIFSVGKPSGYLDAASRHAEIVTYEIH